MDSDLIEGIGESVDAALVDALRSCASSDEPTQTRVEVVAWGASEEISGGPRQIWVKVRRV